MKKKLDKSAIISELRGESPFFPAQQTETPERSDREIKQPEGTDTMPSRHRDTTIPSDHDTTTPEKEDDIFEMVRKAVKPIGKEAATHRFTLEEKHHLADIEYSYKRQGVRTSENEITRIALNYFVEDYHKNGENSLLAKILKRLNS